MTKVNTPLRRILPLLAALVLLSGAFAVAAPDQAAAHRSVTGGVDVSPPSDHRDGCHANHSCPSDTGSYECGDLGNCGQCPDNQYCVGGRPRVAAPVEPPATPPPAATPNAPALGGPAHGAILPLSAVALAWTLPAGATQEQVQLVPAGGDGPGVNIIRNASGGLTIPAPPSWYVLLPDMGYTWRVRATDKATFAGEDDPAWWPWSESRTFRTPTPSAAAMQAVAPANGAPLASAGPVTLQWSHPEPTLFYWEIQVSGDTRFDADPATATSFVWWNLVHGGITSPPNSWQTPPLSTGAPYYWRVRPRVQGDGTPVAWGPAWCFGACVQASIAPAPVWGQQPVTALLPVVKVVDGDTVDVLMEGKTERLRLIGLDTPETVDPGAPVQCYGPEASARAKALLTGVSVRLATDPTQDTRDRYGRLLTYLWLPDGTLYNWAMVRDGYAHEYTYERAYQYQREFRAAEVEAKAAGRGFWGAATCNGDTTQPAG